MTLVRKSNIFIIFLFFIFLLSCTNDGKTVIEGKTMGTTYSITIKEFRHNNVIFKNKIDELLTDINNVFSTYIDDSEISKINNSHNLNFNLSDELKYVLEKAFYYSEISNGMYDFTINPLMKLWGFYDYKHVVPSPNEISYVLENVGYYNLFLNNSVLIKKDNNLKIDLNSIAKGYAVDIVAELIESFGYNNYLVEIGGELRSGQDELIDNGWTVGIQNPSSYSVIKKIKLNNLSMATSGTYNNYFELEGKIFSHIINPKTGYPTDYNIVSVTAISNNCIDADAYATLGIMMDPNKMIEIINEDDNSEIYMIYQDDNQFIEYMSDGFENLIIFN